jgi:hypothetical protein
MSSTIVDCWLSHYGGPVLLDRKMSQRLPQTLSKRAFWQPIAGLSISISPPTFGRAVLLLFWRGTEIFLHNGRNPGFSVQPGVL